MRNPGSPNTTVFLLAILLILGWCDAVEANALPRAGDEKSVADGNLAFAVNLYARLSGQKGNLFLSPHSISTALAMTYAGARGETAAQMRKVLCFRLPDARLHPAFGALARNLKPGKCALHTANRLWSQKGFRILDAFLEQTRTHYGAGLEQVDFAAAPVEALRTINTWVEEKTEEKIKDLLKRNHVDADTVLVLTNAIYFKGQWASRFEKKATRSNPFTLLDGNKVQADMMHQRADFRHARHANLDVVELPYEGGELNMVILLPRKADGLPEVEKALTGARLEAWLSGLSKKKVSVALPRFKMTCDFELGDKLREMGMADAFSMRADFSGITDAEKIFISRVIHKAFVDVNEEGTEAAAATAVVMKRGGPRSIRFRADHPFLFLIRHKKTGSLLFLGRVMNPGQ